jgi:hypothetical protein
VVSGGYGGLDYDRCADYAQYTASTSILGVVASALLCVYVKQFFKKSPPIVDRDSLLPLDLSIRETREIRKGSESAVWGGFEWEIFWGVQWGVFLMCAAVTALSLRRLMKKPYFVAFFIFIVLVCIGDTVVLSEGSKAIDSDECADFAQYIANTSVLVMAGSVSLLFHFFCTV